MKITLRLSQSTRAGLASQTAGIRKGFSLVEVIVAMLLLTIAITSLASLTFSVSQSSVKVSGGAFRNAVAMHEVNRLETLLYDSLAVGSASTTVTSPPYPHTRVVTIAEPVVNVKTVRIVITPVNARFKPDTVNFTRTKARTTRVLNTALP